MKHEIEIPDLPEDFDAVAYKVPEVGEYYFGSGGITLARVKFENLWLVVRKKQARRIVLEETDEDAGIDRNHSIHFDGIIIQIDSAKLWKTVEDGK